MARYREALDQLGFEVQPGAEWLKFWREVDGRKVVIDFMVGPLGDLEEHVKCRNVRVSPKGSSGLHARTANDAIGVEHDPIRLALGAGGRSCEVLVPQAFPFALMKLGALRDRIRDPDKDQGRHHALDLYRIASMLTEQEESAAKGLAAQYQDHPVIAGATRTIEEHLAPPTGLGRIRLREHPLCPPDAEADWLANELRRLIHG